MPSLIPINKVYSVQLLISDGNSEDGSRLGGCPPVNVVPSHITPLTRYFSTIRFSEEPVLEVSIFLSFDFDSMADKSGFIQSSGELFEAITHGESVRSKNKEMISELTPHPIQHGKICEDYMFDDDGSRLIQSNHKLGGYPFIEDKFDVGTAAAVRQAYEEGYFQVVQIDFPGANDGDVDGDWPFADGIFHLLGCEPLEDCSWRCFWEY